MDELLTRSVAAIYPSREALAKVLAGSRKLRIYVGVDPTDPKLHIGHSTNYLFLKKFRQLGHKVVVLVGDFTARIGDPSDKNAARRQLTTAEVKANLVSYQKQIAPILDFNDPSNPVEFVFNSTWLSSLGFADIAQLASYFTVPQMLKRDLFQKRLAENKDLFLHEFLYPLMQGYDSVALEADLEIGGTDQTFNMLSGRTLVRQYQNREKFVIATTLLENPKTGEKLMSKSLGVGVWLSASAEEMFGQVMALPDEGIKQTFVDCTEIPLLEIEKVLAGHPRDAKMRLAHEITQIYHSKRKADLAQENFVRTFQKHGLPTELPKFNISHGVKLTEALFTAGFADSKSEARRLVLAGGVRDIDGTSITDPDFLIEKNLKLKIGKHRFADFVVV